MVVMLCIAFFIVSMLGLAFFCLFSYKKLQNDDIAENDQEYFFLYAAIALFSITGVFLIMICCLWSRIVLVARIIQATADYITDIKRVIVVPIIFLILMVAYVGYWIFTGAYVFSMGETEHDPAYPWGTIKWEEYTRYMVYFKIFALLWMLAFLTYASQFVLISVACIWYFAPDRNNLGSPLCKGFTWAFFFHIGTLAFGSFILAVIWLFQIILSYIHKKVKSQGG